VPFVNVLFIAYLLFSNIFHYFIEVFV